MSINAAAKVVSLVPLDDGTLRSNQPDGGAIVLPIIFSDDFASGDLSHTQGPAKWGGTSGVTVEAGRGVGSTHAASFTFVGNAPGGDATAQLDFDLGLLYAELQLDYDVWYPNGLEPWGGAAFVHRNDSPNNNKHYRIWGQYYEDNDKLGSSTYIGNLENVRGEWVLPGNSGMSQNGPQSLLIPPSDLGKWVHVTIYAHAATATKNGTYIVSKNGEQIIANVGTVNNYKEGYTHGYRYGYLFGAANSGFTDTTIINMDNVVFRGRLL